MLAPFSSAIFQKRKLPNGDAAVWQKLKSRNWDSALFKTVEWNFKDDAIRIERTPSGKDPKSARKARWKGEENAALWRDLSTLSHILQLEERP
jgi:hypothetical protein